MKIVRVSSNKLFTEDGYKKFRAHINRERAGFSKDLRTKFYGGSDVPREKILDSWGETLENSGITKGLLQFEHDLRKKVGPYSIFRPLKDRMKDVESYYGHDDGEPINAEAIELTAKALSKISGLRMRDQNNVVKDLDLSKSSGSPFMEKKNKCVNLTVPVVILGDNNISLNGSCYDMCTVLGHRSQEGGLDVADVKNRIIFMFMFGVNVCEQQVYQPLIKGLQKENLVPAYVNNDAVDLAVTKLFQTKARNECILSTDFEKFDQHFSASLQHAAKQVLMSIFQKNDKFIGWITNVFDLKYTLPLAFNYSGDQVILACGRHGMSSGSGGTNADETLAHMCLQREAAIRSGSVLNPYSMCLGDDGILAYPGISIQNVVDTYSRHGLVMRTDKQHFSSTDAIYLRRYYSTDYVDDGVYRGIYSTYRAIGRLMATERSIPWTKRLIALRQLSIIENCKYHPLKEQFVRWCMKGDKYRLGLDIPGFLDNLENEVKKATKFIPDFIGYNKSVQYKGDPSYGINKWWVVKYLRSIADLG